MMALLEVEEEVERQQHGTGMISLLNIIVYLLRTFIFIRKYSYKSLFSFLNVLLTIYLPPLKFYYNRLPVFNIRSKI